MKQLIILQQRFIIYLYDLKLGHYHLMMHFYASMWSWCSFAWEMSVTLWAIYNHSFFSWRFIWMLNKC